MISGPSGAAGSSSSSKSINENSTAVHKFSANKTVTWSINGGADASQFSINSSTGALTFSSAPDYESPTDSDSGNDYVVVVRATDSSSNTSDQTVTVSVADLDDTNPLITGNNGGAGSSTSSVSVNENQTTVHTFTANETVTWAVFVEPKNADFKFNATSDVTLTYSGSQTVNITNPTTIVDGKLVFNISYTVGTSDQTIELAVGGTGASLAFTVALLSISVGDSVSEGEILAKLDDREAAAQLNQAKASYDLSEQVLNRFEDLRKQGHISIQELDKAKSDFIIAKSQYEFFKVKLEQTSLMSPFNGVIQGRFLDTGTVSYTHLTLPTKRIV